MLSFGAQTGDGTGSFVYMEGSDGSAGDSASLITPLIDLSTAANPYLKYHYHFYGADIQSFYVSVDSGNGFVNVDTITGQQHTSGSAAWSNTIVDLSAFANSSTIRIKFQGSRSVGVLGDMSFDQLSVFDSLQVQTCVDPTNLLASAIACDSALISWISDAGTLFTGLVWDTVGFDPATGGNLVFPTNNFYVINGLSPNTAYDVYVIDSCQFGKTQPVLVQFTTASAPLPIIQYTVNQSNTTGTSAVVDFDASGSQNAGTFTWAFDNGTTVVNGASAQNTYNQNGSDTVNLSITNACGTVDSSFVVDVQGIGINEFVGNSLKVYPNPNNGKFRVSFNTNEWVHVELSLINTIGQSVYQEVLGNVKGEQVVNIDVTTVAEGMYILQVNANGQRSFIKITVQ